MQFRTRCILLVLMASIDRSQFITPTEVPVCALECAAAFEKLTPNEQLYAHHLSRASWAGSRIVLSQTSDESMGIFIIFIGVFSRISVSELKDRSLKQGYSHFYFVCLGKGN